MMGLVSWKLASGSTGFLPRAVDGENIGGGERRQPRLCGFPEGRLATLVYGVGGRRKFFLGRFNVLTFGGLSQGTVSPLKRAREHSCDKYHALKERV